VSYIAEIEHRVAGIPCLIGVIEYNRVRGSYSYHADSDWDYYGYTECEWDILDRRGRLAPWLERKVTDKDTASIKDAISNALED
jgi:hypothetical protein